MREIFNRPRHPYTGIAGRHSSGARRAPGTAANHRGTAARSGVPAARLRIRAAMSSMYWRNAESRHRRCARWVPVMLLAAGERGNAIAPLLDVVRLKKHYALPGQHVSSARRVGGACRGGCQLSGT